MHCNEIGLSSEGIVLFLELNVNNLNKKSIKICLQVVIKFKFTSNLSTP